MSEIQLKTYATVLRNPLAIAVDKTDDNAFDSNVSGTRTGKRVIECRQRPGYRQRTETTHTNYLMLSSLKRRVVPGQPVRMSVAHRVFTVFVMCLGLVASPARESAADTLSGTVTIAAGEPAVDAFITIYGDGFFATQRTDSYGRFAFSIANAGTSYVDP